MKLPNLSGATVFSGIQPTGAFHLGNYFGAVQSWRNLQRNSPSDTELFFFTADLHALTVPQNYSALPLQRKQALASILASGIDPQRAILYHQSEIPEITKLTWILSCFTNLGSLNRMTQFKSKTTQNPKLGLLSYPVLMSADILSVNATHVPVGQDQSQHLELTRDLAQVFNKTIGEDYFNLPQTILSPSKKIVSLRNPLKKMSKSDPDELSKIYLQDDPKDIIKKIKKSQTDSIEGPLTNLDERPGVKNLITIASACNGKAIDELSNEVENFTKSQLKEYVSDLLVKELDEPRRLYLEWMQNPEGLEKVAHIGKEKAREKINKVVKDVSYLVGMSH